MGAARRNGTPRRPGTSRRFRAPARWGTARPSGRSGGIGAKKGDSAVLTMAVENRAAGRLLGSLMGPLSAASLQQKRSFLEGKLGQRVTSALLDLTDDPLVRRGLGSRLYDGEGMAARRFPVFEGGVLRNYYVDNYYGRKLGMAPTTRGDFEPDVEARRQGAGRVAGRPEGRDPGHGLPGRQLERDHGRLLLGVKGFRVRDGRIAEPMGEMNVSGNQLELWLRLVAVGNDPYPYSATQAPTLVFEGVQFAGV